MRAGIARAWTTIGRHPRRLVVALVALTALVGAGGAYAITLRAGDILVKAEGGFRPTALPRHTDAPISIYGSGKASTVSGELPPIVETLTIEFDRHGHVDTQGLEVCTAPKLQATTVPMARKACPKAIVGEGSGSAIVHFPEQAPIPIPSPITLFNGPRSTATTRSSPTPTRRCRCRRPSSSRW